jgi:hypothetical protein
LSKAEAISKARSTVKARMASARKTDGPLCAAFVDPHRRDVKVPTLSDDVEENVESDTFVGKVALFVDVYGSEARCVAVTQITARVVQITLRADAEGELCEFPPYVWTSY